MDNEKKRKQVKFQRRCQDNRFMQYYVLARDERCYFCHKKINDNNFALYRLGDGRCCVSDDTVEVSHPRRKGRMLKIPDCENCCLINADEFDKCVNFLVVVHRCCFKAHRRTLSEK